MWCTLVLAALLPVHVLSITASADKPNIVIIMADDMGFNDVGFHGSDVRTPNLDALAGHGIILSRHYTMPSCTPSRAAMLTARYPIRMGMQGKPLPAGSRKGLPLSEKILPEYFKNLGYKSHLVGKWHLGYQSWDHFPTSRGFDSFYGYLNGYIGYYDGVITERNITGRDFRRGETPIWQEVYGQYLTDVLTKEAVSVIEKHDGHNGLLLILSHEAPHTGNLDIVREAPPGTTNFTGRAILAGMVRKLDDSVGEVVSALNKKGVLNNSIIVFFSDNGAPTEDELYGYNNYGSNWPLRGVKMSSHDGGIRTAALIWSPLFTHPRISTDLFHISDWLPTLYTAAGGSSEDLRNIDGISHWYSLTSGSPGPRSEILLNIDEVSNNEALINKNWKIIRNYSPGTIEFSDRYFGESGRDEPYDPADVENSVTGVILGRPPVPYDEVRQKAAVNDECLNKSAAEHTDCHTKYCLYDIFADSSECQDLSLEYPMVLAELKSKLHAYRGIMVPALNRSVDPRSNPAYWDDFWSPWLNNGVSQEKFSLVYLLPVCILLQSYVV